MTWGKRRALVIILVIVAIVIFIAIASSPARLASNSTLLLEVNGEINEQRPMDLFSAIGGEFVPRRTISLTRLTPPRRSAH